MKRDEGRMVVLTIVSPVLSAVYPLEVEMAAANPAMGNLLV